MTVLPGVCASLFCWCSPEHTVCEDLDGWGVEGSTCPLSGFGVAG